MAQKRILIDGLRLLNQEKDRLSKIRSKGVLWELKKTNQPSALLVKLHAE